MWYNGFNECFFDEESTHYALIFKNNNQEESTLGLQHEIFFGLWPLQGLKSWEKQMEDGLVKGSIIFWCTFFNFSEHSEPHFLQILAILQGEKICWPLFLSLLKKNKILCSHLLQTSFYNKVGIFDYEFFPIDHYCKLGRIPFLNHLTSFNESILWPLFLCFLQVFCLPFVSFGPANQGN